MSDQFLTHGDAIFSTTIRDERPFGWRSFKAPKGKRFVLLLIGVADKDATDFDVDGSLERLGWKFCDSDEHRNGEDPKGLSSEAMPARAEGIAHPVAQPLDPNTEGSPEAGNG